MRGAGRLGAGVVALGLVVLGGAAPAAADPPGPTDYRTVVIAIDPPAPGVEVDIIGGDSLVQLHQRGDVPVDVIGYGGEPYLRFEPDGTVLENQRSPARYLNRDRYGDAQLPPDADADAAPEWEEVASWGTFAWHDHRTHWMSTSRPVGRGPGDQILEAAVPLRVGDRDVDVTMASYWAPGPSPVPAVVGGLVGLVGAALLVVRRRSLTTTAAAAVLGAAAALTLGAWATLSVPSETGPSLLLWALPALGSWLRWLRWRLVGFSPRCVPLSSAHVVVIAAVAHVVVVAAVRHVPVGRPVVVGHHGLVHLGGARDLGRHRRLHQVIVLIAGHGHVGGAGLGRTGTGASPHVGDLDTSIGCVVADLGDRNGPNRARARARHAGREPTGPSD